MVHGSKFVVLFEFSKIHSDWIIAATLPNVP